MITVLSPAKTFNEKPQSYDFVPTVPCFLDDSQKLAAKLKKQSIKGLEHLLSVNRKIASQNKDRFENWQLPFTPDNAKPAAYLFRGEVYIGLDATSLTPAEMDYAQVNLRILSGFYGLVRPKDLLQPYRLEMGTRLKINRHQNLYQFWGSKIADKLGETLESHQHKVIINLASEQYYLSLQPKTLGLPTVTPSFKEDRDGKLKSIHVYAKRARGLMARYIVQNRLEDPQALKLFEVDGYRFSAQNSNEQEYVFVRPHTGPSARG